MRSAAPCMAGADGWSLTRAARADLLEIWLYGAERWSTERADRYQDDMLRALTLIAAHPRIARERTGFGVSFRMHPHAAHLIFYRIVEGGVQILRIGHPRQNWRDVLD